MIRRSNGIAFWFLLPNLSGFLVFTSIPVLAALALSLFQWDLFSPPRFVGLDNFRDLLGVYRDDAGFWQWRDPDFWHFLGNTLFLMLAIPVSMVASLFLAMVLNEPLRGRNLFRVVFYLPSICAGVGLFLLWQYLYNGEFGIINRGLAWIGVAGPGWLTDYHWAKPSLMAMMVWAGMGGTSMILYLAGLQSIAPELYQAAMIDGAGRWARFRHITWPLLAPTTFFIAITSIIAGFQGGFDSAYVMTRGGPNGATTTLNYYIFNHAFAWFNMGYAAAIATVLFAIILVVTAISWRLGGAKGGR